jgi:DNA-binding response OmpR family regulator
LSTATILAIEDEPRNAALLRAMLATSGYQLTTVATLAEARELLADGPVGLVLLDRHLPDGDGLDLARELKDSEAHRATPILLVSASVLAVDRTAAAEAGCDGFIDKPIRLDVLLDAVRQRLGPP